MFNSYTTRFVTDHYFSSLHYLVLYPVQSEYAVGALMLAINNAKCSYKP
jgi:hypothetical protein